MESYDLQPFMSGFLHVAQCFQGSLCWSMYQYFTALYWRTLFHCLSRPHSIHSSVDGHLSISVFGYYEWCCYEHSCVVCMWTCVSSSPGYIPRSGIVELCGKWMFDVLRNCQTVFQSSCTVLYSSNFVTALSALAIVFFFFFNLVISVGVKWCLTVVLICISPLTNDLSILCFLVISYVLFGEMSIQILCLFLSRISFYFYYKGYLCILMQVPNQIHDLQILSTISGFSFHFLEEHLKILWSPIYLSFKSLNFEVVCM